MEASYQNLEGMLETRDIVHESMNKLKDFEFTMKFKIKAPNMMVAEGLAMAFTEDANEQFAEDKEDKYRLELVEAPLATK